MGFISNSENSQTGQGYNYKNRSGQFSDGAGVTSGSFLTSPVEILALQPTLQPGRHTPNRTYIKHQNTGTSLKFQKHTQVRGFSKSWKGYKTPEQITKI